MSKLTLDELNSEIDRVNRAIATGRDRHTMQPLLDSLEKQRYGLIAKGLTPANHLNYAQARDNEQIALLQSAIADIDRQLAGPNVSGRGVLEGDRDRFVKMLVSYGIEALPANKPVPALDVAKEEFRKSVEDKTAVDIAEEIREMKAAAEYELAAAAADDNCAAFSPDMATSEPAEEPADDSSGEMANG
jgi:hypothetical protein